MTTAPWMKFYPSDWRADPALRMCSLSARGLWMDMLSIMHEATPRGHLLINGQPVSDEGLGAVCGARPDEVATLLGELEKHGVFSRKKNGVIFSRRMERDENLSRKNRENGKMGGNPSLCKTSENGKSLNRGDKTQIPDTRYQSNNNPPFPLENPPAELPLAEPKKAAPGKPVAGEILRSDEFEIFRRAYPRRSNPPAMKTVVKSWNACIRANFEPQRIIAAARSYADECHRCGKTGTEFVKMASTWLNARQFGADGAFVAEPETSPQELTPESLALYRMAMEGWNGGRGGWIAAAGSPPGFPDCRVPAFILAEFGIKEKIEAAAA